MSGLEDSLQSALDYEAEVAYISMTSPLRVREESPQSGDNSEDEFDFAESSTPNNTRTVSAVGGSSSLEDPEENSSQQDKAADGIKPPLLSKLNIPRPSLSSEDSEGGLNVPRPSLSSEDSEGRLNNPRPSLSSEDSEGGLATESEPPLSPLSITSPDSLKFSFGSPLKSPMSPLTLEVDYSLGGALPSTPRSKLRRIKDAQAPPTPKPRPKLEQGGHLYCTLVVYGSSGCGRTHLVEKLSLANPSLFTKVVTTTTRKKRPHEAAGVDFHFISHSEMASQLARGEFLEHVKVHRRGEKSRRARKQHSLPSFSFLKAKTSSTPPAAHRDGPRREKKVGPVVHQASVPVLFEREDATPTTKCPSPEWERKYGSQFDLTEEDSPKLGGEMFGTSYQSFNEAVQQEKPCILLNVSSRGAQQLKKAGLRASYVLLQSTTRDDHIYTLKRELPGSEDGDMEADHVISSDSLDAAYAELQQYALELISELKQNNTSGYSSARYQWETLPTVQFEHSQSAPSKKVAHVSFSEMLTHFQTANLKKQMERVKVEYAKPPVFSFSRLTKRLQAEKMMLQAVSFCQLNEKEKLHLRMLQTVYSKLTGNSLTCRRFGTHWQEIGFSGVDPVDDMQEVGLLGLTQLLFFLENARTAKFCKEIFQFCHRSTHVIPFVVMAFEFTQLSLQAVESGLLNKICNKRDQVFVVANEFYMACFFHYYEMWKSSQKSILQLGLLMQQCGDYCKAHPRQVMEEFDQRLSIREPQNQLIPALLPKVENAFTPFDEITTSISVSDS